MKLKYILFLLFICVNVHAGELSQYSENKRILTIYSNHSFSREWAEDGHPIRAALEKKCNCRLELVALDSGGTLLSRLQLEGNNSKADVVLGIDFNLIAYAEESGLFVPYKTKLEHLTLPMQWENKHFVPFDYGYIAFIYDKSKLQNPPKSLHELVYSDNKLKILIQDPRSSTVGYSFVLWVKKIFGDKSVEAWQHLLKKVTTITKSWGESYSLFLKGEADLVLSYTTSLAYHMIVEKKYNFAFADFEEGQYLQVEVAGKLAHAPNPDLADIFLEFITSKEFQVSIPGNNYMYPVIDLGDDMPADYANIKIPTKIIYADMQEVKIKRQVWIREWLTTLSKASY